MLSKNLAVGSGNRKEPGKEETFLGFFSIHYCKLPKQLKEVPFGDMKNLRKKNKMRFFISLIVPKIVTSILLQNVTKIEGGTLEIFKNFERKVSRPKKLKGGPFSLVRFFVTLKNEN